MAQPVMTASQSKSGVWPQLNAPIQKVVFFEQDCGLFHQFGAVHTRKGCFIRTGANTIVRLNPGKACSTKTTPMTQGDARMTQNDATMTQE